MNEYLMLSIVFSCIACISSCIASKKSRPKNDCPYPKGTDPHEAQEKAQDDALEFLRSMGGSHVD